jgi:toxin ParE1/3/4
VTRYAFHPEAAAEYRAATQYYTDIRFELGGRFVAEIESAITRMLDGPERWPVLERDVHRCLAKTFPYGILYTVEADFILIVAVMHLNREPGYWRSRTVR